jgi:teichuronic acid biosynthesis glycosyltransferase TuaC
MLRVLILSMMYPDARRPTFGGFIERQALALAALEGVAVEVVAPVALPRWPLSLHPHYRDAALLPRIEERNGLTVHRPRFPIVPRLMRSGVARRMERALLPVLREIRTHFPFDVINAEYFWPDGVAAAALAKALGVPVSIKARGSDIDLWGTHPTVRGPILDAAVQAEGLLAVSEALKTRTAALGISAEKIKVHHTGLDAERFRPIDRAAAKAPLGISGPLAVTAASLVPLKSHDLALAAVERIPELHWIVVGDGPRRRALESAVRDKDLGARVHLLGARPHEALPGLLGAADVLLHTAEREGLANVWVEALACGTPLVVTETGAAHEVVDRPEAGRVVPRDPAAIAAAVREILADPPPQEDVRKAAERFSWERNAAELFAHLTEISAKRH